MAKKTSSKIIASLSPKYRWEFFRRNEKYINFYKKYVAGKRSSKLGKDVVEQAFYIGWGLSGPADPSKTYEENVKLLKRNIFLPFPVLLKADSTKLGNLLKGTFEIYLNFPKRTILMEFEKQLAPHFKRYRQSLRKVKTGRVNVYVYDRFLGVFDSWEKLSLKEIAKKFYPKEVAGGNLSYAKMSVKRDYRRCKEIINLNYQHLR
ncbi:MAG: hypothetical protein HQL24_04090 [Candidatus Omnitrophica bacterium]|nr:hypothetical protein [Candidatus Omnitrophota bacterium]